MNMTHFWLLLGFPVVVFLAVFLVTTTVIFVTCGRLPLLCKLPFFKHKWVIMLKTGHTFVEKEGMIYGPVLLKYCSRCLETHNEENAKSK